MLAGMGTWLSTTFLKPPKPKPPKVEEPERPLTEEERRQQAILLDPTERKIGYTGVLLGLLISFGLTLPYVFDRHLTVTVKQAGTPTGPSSCQNGFTYTPKSGSHAAQCTGKVVYPVSHWLLLMVLLLVFTIAIFITVRIGKRVPLGFAVLVAGIAYESIVGLLGLIFIVPGAWLLFKAWKVRRDLATGQAPPSSGGPTGRSAAGRSAPGGGAGSNKRYTPRAAPAKGAQPKAARAKGTQPKAAPAKGARSKGAQSKAAPAKIPKNRPTPPTS